MVVKRISKVPSLYQIIGKGAEGGNEFARIVDLLLFHEARRKGKTLTLFNDTCGDFCGLDSFEDEGFRKCEKLGYQYKFFSSPLKPEQRATIETSLLKVKSKQKELKLKKWILVTPEDFIEQSASKDTGEVTWFNSLKDKLMLDFEIEHWGHKNIIALFLDTPSLCLYYYPELLPEGYKQKKTIKDIRKRYDEGLKVLYDRIEFVGMSVYKQEATRGIPMQDIYIPLSLASSVSSYDGEINPLECLKANSKCVILGDPGSGKSTLLKFFTLIGNSPVLQKKFSSQEEHRLPILVILRQYCNELQKRTNLSMIDYIQENIHFNMNLKSVDLDFLEYYLETGQAILLFDGLDELPSSQYKKIIRDQICTLNTTYPGNTCIVTSRIIGYDSTFCFDKSKFLHYYITKLKMKEIKKFIAKWYIVRIDNIRECRDNIKDLIHIIQNKEEIYELAKNPLLLTIIVLVHRIDAVLPDERVVLYAKCTETLLNTWHTWKYRELQEQRNRSRIEKRNRFRMESIAYWMHCCGGSKKKSSTNVVSYEELKEYLLNHIKVNEKYCNLEEDPEETAESFISFLREKAGLLIEIGDEQFSFIHLTFQEYLAASYIKTFKEQSGALGYWGAIADYTNDTQWNEVIRLLIANLNSNDTQKWLVEKIIEENVKNITYNRTILLEGLIIDNIEPAIHYIEYIFKLILAVLVRLDNSVEYRHILKEYNSIIRRKITNIDALLVPFEKIFNKCDLDHKKKLIWILYAMRWPEAYIEHKKNSIISKSKLDAVTSLVIYSNNDPIFFDMIEEDIKLIRAIYFYLFTRSSMYKRDLIDISPYCLLAIMANFSYNIFDEVVFTTMMYFLCPPTYLYTWLCNSSILSMLERTQKEYIINDASKNSDRMFSYNMSIATALDLITNKRKPNNDEKENMETFYYIIDLHGQLKISHIINYFNSVLRRCKGISSLMTKSISCDYSGDSLIMKRNLALNDNLWEEYAQDEKHSSFISLIQEIFNISPPMQWQEAFRICFFPMIKKVINLYNKVRWDEISSVFVNNTWNDSHIYGASWRILLDAIFHLYEHDLSVLGMDIGSLVNSTYNINNPPLKIANIIRDIAYGKSERVSDLKNIFQQEDPLYVEIFRNCFWRNPQEDEVSFRNRSFC